MVPKERYPDRGTLHSMEFRGMFNSRLNISKGRKGRVPTHPRIFQIASLFDQVTRYELF